jgi:hypothetical protein
LFCPRCHERIDENWSFCPRCGAKLPSSGSSTGSPPATPVSDLFKDIEKQMKDALGADGSRDIQFFDLKPEFTKKNPFFRSGGFRVKITRAGDGPPEIDIKSFGDIDEKMAERMKETLEAQKVKAATWANPTTTNPAQEEAVEEESPIREVSEYQEPMCITKWVGDHLVVDLDLPDVESSDDIDIKKLGESIEVRAFAGNKGYFKILSIPKEAKLISRRFKEEKLSLKIG